MLTPKSRFSTERKVALLNQMRNLAEVPPAERPVAPFLQKTPLGFDELPESKQLQIQEIAGALVSVENPFYRTHDVGAGATTQIDGKEVTNFASYDYLGTNRHPYVHGKIIDSLSRFGVSASASRVVAGERPVHAELETKLAKNYDAEAAVVFVSGYLSNVTTIATLLEKEDLILHDELIHNSILTGIKLSGATRRFFRHNDMQHLEELLAGFEGKFRRILVVAEGIYSMDGDIADLPSLVDLRDRFGFWLMIDDAHALGVLGSRGRGTFEHYNIDPKRVDIWAGTLSKTTSSCGGYIVGSSALIGLLKGSAGGFVYSVGLSPLLATGALASLEIMEREPERIARLRANSQFFLEEARVAGLDTGLSLGYSVIPIKVGDSIRAARLSNELLARSVNAMPIIYPAVPEGHARLRFFITSEHTREQIKSAVGITANCLDKLIDENFGINMLDHGKIMQLLAES